MPHSISNKRGVGLLAAYQRIVRKIALASGILAALSMMVLVLMTVADVFLRFFFNSPILGSFELTEYLLIPITFFSLSWATSEKANVRIDLIVGKFKEKTRNIVFAIACLLSLFFTFILAWFTIPQAMYIKNVEIVSQMLDIPAYPFYLISALGFFILFFVLISELIDFIEGAMGK